MSPKAVYFVKRKVLNEVTYDFVAGPEDVDDLKLGPGQSVESGPYVLKKNKGTVWNRDGVEIRNSKDYLELLLRYLKDIIGEYNKLSVSQFKLILGYSAYPEYDDKLGWTTLENIVVKKDLLGPYLMLPEPWPFDQKK